MWTCSCSSNAKTVQILSLHISQDIFRQIIFAPEIKHMRASPIIQSKKGLLKVRTYFELFKTTQTSASSKECWHSSQQQLQQMARNDQQSVEVTRREVKLGYCFLNDIWQNKYNPNKYNLSKYNLIKNKTSNNVRII